MSAFEDYCIVCEKACDNGSAYCSQNCKDLDQQNLNSPTLSICSNGLLSLNGSFTLDHSKSHSNSIISNNNNNNNNNNTVPKILSPLLTPQIINNNNNGNSSVKSPNLKDLTYESPLLSSSLNNPNLLTDLDSNRLDLNNSISISQRLSKSLKRQNKENLINKNNIINNVNNVNNNNNNNNENPKNVTNVSNMLRSSSENYKKWLSIH